MTKEKYSAKFNAPGLVLVLFIFFLLGYFLGSGMTIAKQQDKFVEQASVMVETITNSCIEALERVSYRRVRQSPSFSFKELGDTSNEGGIRHGN